MNITLTDVQEKIVMEYVAKAGFKTAADALVHAAMRYIESWLAPGQRADSDTGNNPVNRP